MIIVYIIISLNSKFLYSKYKYKKKKKNLSRIYFLRYNFILNEQ